MAGHDLRLSLTDGSSGRPVDDLLVHDNALIHLVVISPSGTLQHLHPIRVGPGEYRARLRTGPGVHAIAAEIARRGGGVQLLRSSVSVTGEANLHANEGKADLSTQIRPAGSPSTVTARFGTGDLQPWLGMLGHMIVVGPLADGQNHAAAPIWAHVHAMLPSTPGLPDKPDESVAAFGPDVSFTYSFPLPGRYLVWVQVERDYSIVTVPTVVEVPKGAQG